MLWTSKLSRLWSTFLTELTLTLSNCKKSLHRIWTGIWITCSSRRPCTKSKRDFCNVCISKMGNTLKHFFSYHGHSQTKQLLSGGLGVQGVLFKHQQKRRALKKTQRRSLRKRLRSSTTVVLVGQCNFTLVSLPALFVFLPWFLTQVSSNYQSQATHAMAAAAVSATCQRSTERNRCF